VQIKVIIKLWIFLFAESFPPNISAPEIFTANVGVDSNYLFTVTGSINVTVVINGQESLLLGSGNTFTVTWRPANINDQYNVTIIATAEQNARAVFAPRVQLCGCINGGNCTTAGVLNLQLPFNVLNCECPEGKYPYSSVAMYNQ